MPGRLGDIGPYHLIERIGQGGLSRVYLAHRGDGDDPVALKQVVLREPVPDSLRDALIESTRRAMALRHPNLVSITDLLEEGSGLSIAMEFVDGVSLHDLLRRSRERGDVPPAIAVGMVLQLCEGLAFLHGATGEGGEPLGLVHGLVKPSNVLVGRDGLVKLTDFGLAPAEIRLLRSPAYAAARGTRLYLSPEQVNRTQVTHHADQFSLAAVAAEAVTGRYPFRGKSVDAVLRAIAAAKVSRTLRSVHRRCPPLVEPLRRAFSLRPDTRYDTVSDLAQALREAVDDAAGPEEIADWLAAWTRDPGPDVHADDAPAEPHPGTNITGRTIAGKFEVSHRIGAGGMGEVYLARQGGARGREVVIKVLTPPPDVEVEPELFEKLFLREAAAAAALKSSYTIEIYDFGQTRDGIFYIVMEYLRGASLHEIVHREGALDAERARHVMLQVARSLREAHEHGIVHRDLKPANVMLVERNNDPDFAKVLDFGLVKRTDRAGDRSELTLAGRFIGSPKYAAPEQLQSRADIDQRADIYAFGLLLYFVLAGAPPFEGDMRQIIASQILSPPPPMEQLNPDIDVPPEIAEVVYRCLEKNPADRFQSMSEVIDLLQGDASGSYRTYPSGTLRAVSDERPYAQPAVSPAAASPAAASPVATTGGTAEAASAPGDGPVPSGPRQAPPAPPSTAPRRSLLPWIAGLGGGAVLIAAGIAGGFTLAHLARAPGGPSVGEEAAAAAKVAAEVVTPAAGDASPPEPEEPATGEAADLSTAAIDVRTRPAGASVSLYRGGRETLLGTTPLEVTIDLVDAERDGPVVLVLRREGYRDKTVRQVPVDGRISVETSLRRRAPEPATPEPEEPATPDDVEETPDGFKANPYG